jgi:hypothetical protein
MKKLVSCAVLASAILISCTDADRSKMGGYGEKYKVKVLGPDTVVVYESTGKVLSESRSDGYYFTNAATGKLIEVSGTVIIEEE